MSDVDLIMRAMSLAEECHEGQKRKYTGEPYIVHPMGVAMLVYLYAPLGDLSDMIAAAWLHDVLEDTDCSPNEIAAVCGVTVLSLVEELTQKSKPEDGNRATRKRIDREYLWTVSKNAQIIKCCDIIHNCHGIANDDQSFFRVYKTEARALLEGFHECQARTDALETISSYEAK